VPNSSTFKVETQKDGAVPKSKSKSKNKNSDPKTEALPDRNIKYTERSTSSKTRSQSWFELKHSAKKTAQCMEKSMPRINKQDSISPKKEEKRSKTASTGK
jgi:hypothetical protein